MDFEKLGAFYLGRDLEDGSDTERPTMYDARDLTTHAVCIGMTGSGKTGLCIDLLEEAALDRVPAIIIDPKGDITNLLLTFPDLAPEDFRPWVNADDARRKEMELDEFAAHQAELWANGLARWGQDGGRIRILRETADFAVFTPGSDAGIPVSVVSSFRAPETDWESDSESILDRIESVVSGILGLIGVEADPIQSREHILLSRIFQHFWQAGRDLDLARLILSIQDPPFRKLGVFDIDASFPQKDRRALAMRLNNLIAAPGFQAWTRGQPLDVASLLQSPDGRPRHSVFYIAHLSEAERMFFVTLLLGAVVTWMRSQPGTTSLRALVYMDEIQGFLPPVADPPSKKPFLTLFKQARAYGLGVVLTTQNPVDLDYKALTNAGTWFIGRLQTERDKARLLEGLVSAGAAADADFGARISALDKRVFLLHNVHEPAPIEFRTRWAMSYLRGPLTRDQVSRLMEGREPDRQGPAPVRAGGSGAGVATAGGAPARESLGSAFAGPDERANGPPVLADDLPQRFLPVEVGRTGALQEVERRYGATFSPDSIRLVYRPTVAATADVHFLHRKSNLQTNRHVALVATLDGEGRADWAAASVLPPESGATGGPDAEAVFLPLPAGLNDARDLKGTERDLSEHLYRSSTLQILHAPDVDAFSEPGQSEADFRMSLTQAARERRDEQVDELSDRYGKRIEALDDRIRRARQRVDATEADADARRNESILSIVETGIGALLGRRSRRAASSSLGKVRQTSAARQRAEAASENLAELVTDMEELQTELAERVAAVRSEWDAAVLDLETVIVTPRRTDVQVDEVALAWLPEWHVIGTVDGHVVEHRIPATGGGPSQGRSW